MEWPSHDAPSPDPSAPARPQVIPRKPLPPPPIRALSASSGSLGSSPTSSPSLGHSGSGRLLLAGQRHAKGSRDNTPTDRDGGAGGGERERDSSGGGQRNSKEAAQGLAYKISPRTSPSKLAQSAERALADDFGRPPAMLPPRVPTEERTDLIGLSPEEIEERLGEEMMTDLLAALQDEQSLQSLERRLQDSLDRQGPQSRLRSDNEVLRLGRLTQH